MAEEKLPADMSEKLKALEAARLQIEKQFGTGSLMKLGTKTDLTTVDVIPSGSILLDEALGVGGYPRGRIIEMYGPESSGKTTLALHAIAEAQKLGGIAAFIDAEHALDPVYAKNLGVNIDELWVSKMLAHQRAQHKEDEEPPLVNAQQHQPVVDGLVACGHRRPAEPIQHDPDGDKHDARPPLPHDKLHRGIDDEEFQQGQREPVTRLVFVHQPVPQGYALDMQEDDQEQQRDEQLHGNLLLEKPHDAPRVPHHARLVQHKAADEEEQRHPHLHQVIVDGDALAHDAPTQRRHMLQHHQEHGETPQRVDIPDALRCALMSDLAGLRHGCKGKTFLPMISQLVFFLFGSPLGLHYRCLRLR